MSEGYGEGGRPAAALSDTSRRTRADLRSLVLSAGVDLVDAEGLSRGVEHLTFKRVFEHVDRTAGVRVTHGSVIGRLWPNQAEFQMDVVVALIERAGAEHGRRTLAAFQAVARSADRSSVSGRVAAVREAHRVGCMDDYASLVAIPEWRALLGLWALAISQEPASRAPTVQSALRQAHDDVIRRSADALVVGLAYYGLRLRAPFTPHDYALAVDRLVGGFSFDGSLSPAAGEVIEVPRADGQGTEPWTLYGLALYALAEQFFEPDPDWVLPRGAPGRSVGASVGARSE